MTPIKTPKRPPCDDTHEVPVFQGARRVATAYVSRCHGDAVDQYQWTMKQAGDVMTRIEGRPVSLQRFCCALEMGEDTPRRVNTTNRDRLDARYDNLLPLQRCTEPSTSRLDALEQAVATLRMQVATIRARLDIDHPYTDKKENNAWT